MTTYLAAVNDVLMRLRESSVASVSTNNYSQLIGQFVNDFKRQVEDAWKWSALQTTLTLTATPGTSTYTLTGSGRRFRDVTINTTNVNNQSRLINAPLKWIQDQQQLTTTTPAQPTYYAWNGTDGTDSKMELFPTPDIAYTYSINLYVPQADLSSDATVITVPAHPVILGAYARALVERGEDGGLSSAEAYQLYRSALADEIANESARFCENDCFEAV